MSKNHEWLIRFIEGGNITEVRRYINHGVDINKQLNNFPNLPKKDYFGVTVLHLAVEVKNENIVKLLLESGADVNAQDRARDTPLHYVMEAEDPNIQILDLLISHGANIDFQNREGKTPLYKALKFGNDEGAKQMIIRGCNVNIPNSDYGNISEKGFTPLHHAAYWRKENIVRLLLEYGADKNAVDWHGNTPQYYATKPMRFYNNQNPQYGFPAPTMNIEW